MNLKNKIKFAIIIFLCKIKSPKLIKIKNHLFNKFIKLKSNKTIL